jgi:hypothetical protein
MPLPVVTDGFYAAYRFTLDDAQSAEWTLAFTTAETDVTQMALDLISAWASELAGAISNQVNLVSVLVQPLDGTSAAHVEPAEEVGGFSGEPVPDNVAMVVTFRTALAGRSHRGRAYIPGVATAALDSNNYQWGASNTSAMSSDFDNWQSAIATSTSSMTHGVLSRTLGVITPVTSYQARRTLATQRRRVTGGVIF